MQLGGIKLSEGGILPCAITELCLDIEAEWLKNKEKPDRHTTVGPRPEALYTCW